MEYYEILLLIGRIIFGGFFLMMSMNHFKKTEMLTNYAQSKNVPMPKAAVLFSGLLLLAGGLGIVLGIYVEWAVLALVVFLITISFKMHDFWNDTDPNMKMNNMQNFMKNMALMGAALMLLSIPMPWAYALVF